MRAARRRPGTSKHTQLSEFPACLGTVGETGTSGTLVGMPVSAPRPPTRTRHAPAEKPCRPLIRPALADDLRTIARLDAAAFPMPDRWTLTDFRTDFRATDTLYLIAVCCDRTVGYLHAGRDGDAAWLLALFVESPHRRLGLASRFLDAFTDWADDEGADEAVLQVAYGNTAAAQLYLDAGFDVTGDLRNYYAPGRHAVELRKPLL